MIDTSRTKIGKSLAFCRRSKGYTQEELAEKLGVSREMVSKWEEGKRNLHAVAIFQICKTLNISADYLLDLGNDVATREASWKYLAIKAKDCARKHLEEIESIYKEV